MRDTTHMYVRLGWARIILAGVILAILAGGILAGVILAILAG